MPSPPAHASRTSDALKRELGPSVKVAAHAETGQVRFVGAAARPIETGAATDREAARAFLARHGDAFGGGELEVTSSRGSSVRFQQVLEGVPVLGGELIVNLDSRGRILSASGEPVSPSRRVTSERERAAARQTASSRRRRRQEEMSAAALHASTPTLWVYDSS